MRCKVTIAGLGMGPSASRYGPRATAICSRSGSSPAALTSPNAPIPRTAPVSTASTRRHEGCGDTAVEPGKVVQPPKKLLIVYHTMTGGTLQMARAAADGGGNESTVQVRLLRAFEAGPDDVITADGLIFATPENLAAMSGALKDFFDRSYYGALERVNGRPYASLVCAGSDGQNAARQIARIATGWRLKPIAEPLIVCTHAQAPEDILREKQIGSQDLERCRALGEVMAAGLALGIF